MDFYALDIFCLRFPMHIIRIVPIVRIFNTPLPDRPPLDQYWAWEYRLWSLGNTDRGRCTPGVRGVSRLVSGRQVTFSEPRVRSASAPFSGCALSYDQEPRRVARTSRTSHMASASGSFLVCDGKVLRIFAEHGHFSPATPANTMVYMFQSSLEHGWNTPEVGTSFQAVKMCVYDSLPRLHLSNHRPPRAGRSRSDANMARCILPNRSLKT